MPEFQDPKYRHAFLVCADQDDFGLIALADLARRRGIALEILTGAEREVEPLLHEMLKSPRGMFVLVETEHLPAHRCVELARMFEDVRRPGQHLARARFDLRDPKSMFEYIVSALRLASATSTEANTEARGAASKQAAPDVRSVVDLDADLNVDKREDDDEDEVTGRHEALKVFPPDW